MALFPDAPRPWLDLSTGINPVAYPVGTIDPLSWTRLPEPRDLAELEAAAARAFAMVPADAGKIVAAPGTQALIQLLPRLVAAVRVAVVGPTYGEHAAVWAASGATVIDVPDLESALATEADAIVIVNPNNPDGRVAPREELAAAAGALARWGGLLIVDEAFVDLEPGASLLGHGLPPATLVLRSFGKTWGLAGLRLGFLVAHEPIAAAARAALGPWAVSGPAIEIGRRALGDDGWRAATIARLDADVARLDALLTRARLTVIGGTRLFRLVSSPRAADWFQRLCAAGILVRPFDAAPDRLRFGLPPADGWLRLEAALAGVP